MAKKAAPAKKPTVKKAKAGAPSSKTRKKKTEVKPKTVVAEIVEDHEPASHDFEGDSLERVEKIQPAEPGDESFDDAFEP
ncbi:MAG TPA: hypothetical protein PL182_06015, partial [Pseudobdellovibrionaceae bacterium]|nr:hypothetical protein [Pseudobdellovibrionaceae bacterium]